MTDLSTIVAAERDIDIKHPVTEEEIGLRITLLPSTHPQVKAAARKSLNERLAGKGKLTAEKIEQNRMDMLVASVSGWDWQGDLTFKGEKPAFNDDNLRKVLKHLSWMQDQIDAELGNSADFFPS
ncbi:hypothetical protein [Xanthomonas translucens]|uniref:Uncharacterized protein n=2 Tax=Xanthomonas campestris pv. translucens TaxID=343 RepID=A0A109HRP9_XANCT|nr:hypothetical protein [Xanthomonas translucens]AVY67161.1 hypothetical protein NZ30_12760 [Xanthomonas translucens pv. undulosa]KWV17133.1 hypothetical protein ATB53_00180 [Xanthomonas translucens]MCT8281749.1 hypothetical protein [Xanthomonas translucens pv. undulosa]MCT8316497.1 hypothetical protein [Xanthomonas translucens pv. undulosa]QSQ34711.1 hypothetical protein ISN31_03545 [Xanthomonas translucens pv. translucens]